MDTKVCSICEVEKELSEYYSYNKKKANGDEYIYFAPYCKDCTIERNRKYALENPERARSYDKKYYSKPENKQRHKVNCRNSREKGVQIEWQRNNTVRVKGYNLKRSEKNHEISKSEWESCKEYFNYECSYCGISEQLAKETQGNRLHKEHVHHDGANDLSNCVPSCKVCNSSKHDIDFNEWFSEENEIFTYERLEKIHNWLDTDYKNYINS